jgi:cold shock CspA family protein/predicted small secreted protein
MRSTRPRPAARRAPTLAALVPLLLVSLAAAACGTVGGGGRDDRGRAAEDVVGEVMQVELFERQILVRNTFDRVIRVRYEPETPVFFRGEQYRVENLEPGDLVRVDVLGDAQGVLVAQRIDVEESVQDRGGRTDRPPAIDEVEGEVVGVERLPNLIVLSSRDRGTLRIAYSADTPVYYRGEQFAVSNLEPGDEVRVEVRQESGGGLRTDYVVVTRSIQERDGGTGGTGGIGDDRAGDVETFTGRVDRVERDRGRFTVATDTRGTLTVLMPYQPLAADQQMFERLRSGQRVRFDGEWLGEGRVALVRFDTRY